MAAGVRALPDRRMLRLRGLRRQIFSPGCMAPVLPPGIHFQNDIRLRSTTVCSGTGPLDNFPPEQPSPCVPDSIQHIAGQPTDAEYPGGRSKIAPARHDRWRHGGYWADIPVCRVTPMSVLESQSQRVCFARNHDQVNVIGHEAVADQGKLMQSSIISEKVKIDEPFGIGSENEFAGHFRVG